MIVKVTLDLFNFGVFFVVASALIGIANVSMTANAVIVMIDFLMMFFIMFYFLSLVYDKKFFFAKYQSFFDTILLKQNYTPC